MYFINLSIFFFETLDFVGEVYGMKVPTTQPQPVQKFVGIRPLTFANWIKDRWFEGISLQCWTFFGINQQRLGGSTNLGETNHRKIGRVKLRNESLKNVKGGRVDIRQGFYRMMPPTLMSWSGWSINLLLIYIYTFFAVIAWCISCLKASAKIALCNKLWVEIEPQSVVFTHNCGH